MFIEKQEENACIKGRNILFRKPIFPLPEKQIVSLFEFI